MEPNKFIPGVKPETMALYNRLLNQPVGTILTYEDLSGVIHKDVQDGARHYLISAIRRLRSQQGQVWSNLRGKGIQRLDDTGIVSVSKATVKKGYRAFGKAKSILGCADYAKLTDQNKLEYAAVQVAASIAQTAAGKTGQDRIKAEIGKSSAKQIPDTKAALEWFKK